MKLDLQFAITTELHEMNMLLKGLTYIPPEETKKMVYQYSSDRDYYCDRFLIKARLLLSKCKSDIELYNSVHSRILEVALSNNYLELSNKLDSIAGGVWNSRLPEDNLYTSYALPAKHPKNPQITPVMQIVTGIGRLIKGCISFIFHDKFFSLLIFVGSVLVAFVISYIQYPQQTLAFLNHIFQYLYVKK